jgi:hypothetical protein
VKIRLFTPFAAASRPSAAKRRAQASGALPGRGGAVVIALALLSTLNVPLTNCFAQGSAFTYQGRLNVNGQPANGVYDFQFRLYDAATDGGQVPVIPVSPGVVVSNGLFTTGMNFGDGVFNGTLYWLEIAVQSTGGGGFTTLTPRQQVVPVPGAIFAGSASNLLGALPATQLSGTILDSSLPGNPNFAGTVTASSFSGSGAALTSLNAGNLSSGTIPDARLSANVAQLVGGTLPDSGLSSNVARLNSNQTFTGINTFNQRIAVNGLVESSAGGVKFPDGSIQTKAASKIIASANMQFSLDDRTGWTHLEALGDDNCFGNIPLGFTYTGFGINTANVSLSSNGILFFGNNCVANYFNSGLPTGISPDAMLFFFWDDLYDYGTGEFAEYATFGTAPGRVFNLYFRSRLLSSECSNIGITAMISIHESSGLINVTYSGFNGCPALRGGNATLGFQTPGGASATAFMMGFNVPLLDDNTPGQSMSFHPPN